MSTGVRVAVRFRPVNKVEKNHNAKVCVQISGCRRACRIKHPGNEQHPYDFSFDQVYNSTTAQDDVYKFTGKPLSNDAIEGFNSTLFAYGQTGSGKTWSMMGIPNDEANAGIVPRLGKDLFNYVDEYAGTDRLEVSIQMYQIYLGVLQDLFNPIAENLKISMGGKGGVFVKDATEQRLYNFEEYMGAVDFGNSNRNTSATKMNAESSRSHCIIVLKFTRIKQNGTKIVSKIKMVDLAGSEKVGKTEATADRLKEAKAINRSLTALATCMVALSKPGHHVPFRTATLTKMLSDSLGGNCKTSLLCATSPCDWNVDETLSTLRFAAQAKKVKTKVQMAVEYSEAELRKLVGQYKTQLDHNKEQFTFLEELDKVVEEFVATNGGDYDAMKKQVHASLNKSEEVDMSNMSFHTVSSHVCVIDKKTGLMVAGKVKNVAIREAGEVETVDADDSKDNGVPAITFGKSAGGASSAELAELREHVDDLTCDSEGKDMLIHHLESELEGMRSDLESAVNAASKFEGQIAEAEFYKRKLVYLEQDVVTQLEALQIENEMLNNNLSDIDQLDALAANGTEADFRKMVISMKKQLRKKNDQVKKMLAFKAMDDKYMAKFDTLDTKGQRALFAKALRMNTAARGNVEQAKCAKTKFGSVMATFKRKEHAQSKLKTTWKSQLSALERAIVLAREVHQRDSTKFSTEIAALKQQNTRLQQHVQKLRGTTGASRQGSPDGASTASPTATKVKGARKPTTMRKRRQATRRRRGSISA